MSRILIIILLIAGLIFWWHWQNTPDAAGRKRLLQKTVIYALVIITLILVLAGRMHWLGVVFAGLLAFLRQGGGLLIRYFPILTQLYRSYSPVSKAPNVSTVTSKVIEMTLNHDTAKLNGKVILGEFKGMSLDDLDQQELQTLHQFCQQTDTDSARLLECYLAGRFGEDRAQNPGEQQAGPSPPSNMSVSEALQVLGLRGKPTREEITRAYRKVMQQLHPDRGGNDYFAAKANQARDLLIENFC